jgi:uncharacterized protein (DUF952 family)
VLPLIAAAKISRDSNERERAPYSVCSSPRFCYVPSAGPKIRMTKIVYKILSAGDWAKAQQDGGFAGSPDDIRDGFVHLSASHQVRGTIEKHFNGQHDLIVIAFEVQRLGDQLKWEASRSSDLFPHLYGELPIAQALWHRPILRDARGLPRLDELLPPC